MLATTNTIAQDFVYEPTSVLDPHQSPSPETEKPVVSGVIDKLSQPNDQPPLDLDDHALQNFDWDSVMGYLEFHDESVVPALTNLNPQFSRTATDSHQITHQLSELVGFNQFVNPDFNISDGFSNAIPSVDFTSNWSSMGLDFVQELIKAADCFDSNELQLAQVILDRLNQRLRSPDGKPIERAAFFFKEALQSLLDGSIIPNRLSSWPEIVQTIRAYKAFSSMSPIPMFTLFTANQALLESMEGSPPFIHIIDFDIGLGGQYASLMGELAEKAISCKINAPVLRITAVVAEEYAIETRLIKENLTQFAQELKIRFQIEFVLIRTFEMLAFKAVKFVDGERIAVLLSPTIFRRLGTTTNFASFFSDLRRLSPSVVVFVDNEECTESGAASFRQNFINSLEFYSVMFESLDAAVAGSDWERRIEMFLLRPKIFAAVQAAGRRVAPPWRELFGGAGMKPVQLSQFADFQAEFLLSTVQVDGFRVAKRQADLVLYWHQHSLVATTAWKCR
ncbi:scarecrow transcription factor family protein [Tripterygium wilfordii]|uniref:Scarecrow transcription factor family protein n=1 Tax=Tripterygium wilfordii TaxID=458696 RepID=A0A7J7E349_TRIWF|nr:scarecrow-like protein 15 [Tripterygium wilfordii]KAF5752959.1 scarecrow transcription factor family protein [Tripterygium wilfordii]